jgi:hypothetical protein
MLREYEAPAARRWGSTRRPGSSSPGRKASCPIPKSRGRDACCQARTSLRPPPARNRWRVFSVPRRSMLVPLKNALDQARFLAGGSHRPRSRPRRPRGSSDDRLCEQLQAAASGPSRISRRGWSATAATSRADRLARGRRRRPRVRRRRRRQGAGRLPGRPVAAAGDGRDRASAAEIGIPATRRATPSSPTGRCSRRCGPRRRSRAT